MISAGDYRFGADTGRMLVRTFRTGLGSRAGHDLVIEVTSWQGRLTVDPDAADASAQVSVDVDSFEVREGRGGLLPLTDDNRAEIKKTIRDQILHTERYPHIEFQSATIRGTPSDATVEGNLTICGVTRPISVTGGIDESGGVPSLRVQTQVRQTDWGIKPYSAFLGALKLRDEVDVDVDATLQRSSPDTDPRGSTDGDAL